MKSIKITILPQTNGAVYFHSLIKGIVVNELGKLPSISLSQTHGFCLTPLSYLQDHNHHAAGQSQDKMKAFIERVKKEIVEKMKASGLEFVVDEEKTSS